MMTNLIQQEIHSQQAPGNTRLTRLALQVNACTCLVFGLMFYLNAPGISVFLGAVAEFWLRFVGLALLVHAAHLTLGSMRSKLSRLEIYYFSSGDLFWFLGSLLLLAATDAVTTSHGVMTVAGVAILVLLIGLVQLWTYSRGISAPVPGSLRNDHPLWRN